MNFLFKNIQQHIYAPYILRGLHSHSWVLVSQTTCEISLLALGRNLQAWSFLFHYEIRGRLVSFPRSREYASLMATKQSPVYFLPQDLTHCWYFRNRSINRPTNSAWQGWIPSISASVLGEGGLPNPLTWHKIQEWFGSIINESPLESTVCSLDLSSSQNKPHGLLETNVCLHNKSPQIAHDSQMRRPFRASPSDSHSSGPQDKAGDGKAKNHTNYLGSCFIEWGQMASNMHGNACSYGAAWPNICYKALELFHCL